MSKFLITEIVKTKKGDDIKNALILIFKKIEKMQNELQSHIHLKRFSTDNSSEH